MVILLALYPLVAAAAVALLDLLTPLGVGGFLASSPVFASMLAAAVLAAVLVAAVRHRDSPVLGSAWLFLFCGELILALGWIVEPYVPADAHWMEEIFELTAFVPLAAFVAYVVSPLRIIVLSRSRSRGFSVLAGLLLLAVAAVALLPLAVGLGGPRQVPPSESLLHVTQAVLESALLEPLALILLVVGITRGSGPYALVGAGLLLLLPEDLLMSYGLFAASDVFSRYAHLAFLASQLLVLNGALLAAARRRTAPASGSAAAPASGSAAAPASGSAAAPGLTEPPAR